MDTSLVRKLPLAATARDLASGALPLADFLNRLCDRLEAVEPVVAAFLPENGRRERLLREAAALEKRYPDPGARPPLYGIPVGVKDLFRADGFPTRCGSALPPECFAGQEAAVVTTVKKAGALVLGKTVTTEFAYFQPGPTRNPHNPDHTPGGSSSGSAAAVAAGETPLAFGTQTIGSISRPAAFCGVLGFKPSFGRIDATGVIPFSPSVDHIGFFTSDMEGIILAASLLVDNWRGLPETERKPVLGVPVGPYLEQADPETRTAFHGQLARLEADGFTLREVAVLDDIARINGVHRLLIAAEIAAVHAAWFKAHESLYSGRTAELIREGQGADPHAVSAALDNRLTLRRTLTEAMHRTDIDLFLMPSAPGGAPRGTGATGNPVMNLPWTHAGLPTLSIPAGRDKAGMPLSLQLAARFMEDEQLLALTTPLVRRFSGLD